MPITDMTNMKNIFTLTSDSGGFAFSPKTGRFVVIGIAFTNSVLDIVATESATPV